MIIISRLIASEIKERPERGELPVLAISAVYTRSYLEDGTCMSLVDVVFKMD